MSIFSWPEYVAYLGLSAYVFILVRFFSGPPFSGSAFLVAPYKTTGTTKLCSYYYFESKLLLGKVSIQVTWLVKENISLLIIPKCILLNFKYLHAALSALTMFLP